MRMSFEKCSDVPQGNLVDELKAHVTHLKEEIRSTFARHRKSLESRELWLLGQADSINWRTLSFIVKHQISVATVKARLEECGEFMQFSKDHKDADGFEHASQVMSQLQKKGECMQLQYLKLPRIKFVHEQTQLGSAILSYGKLLSSVDDTVSCSTERPWDFDFANEKANLEYNSKNGCCPENGLCDKPTEIEDMDSSTVLCGGDCGVGVKKISQLNDVCKANESCNSISKCVCETPCSAVTLIQNIGVDKNESNVDPLAQLRKTLDDELRGSPERKAMEGVENLDHCLSNADETTEDPLLQISNAMQNILSTPIADEGRLEQSFNERNLFPDHPSFIDDLHRKLQGILDGRIEPIAEKSVESDNKGCAKKSSID